MNETTTVPGTPRAFPRSLPLGRRGLVLSAMTLIAAGLALNWGWLTAVGAAPLILSLAPCTLMCGLGLGLCMQSNSKSCTSKSNPAGEPDLTKN
ncbi:hypothetical protein [Pseudohoeflea coraliihabitans]|uniref:DUF2933 domain-containing protein n=1 Tax=Pseudohoeflea coraliihabitans TaxID=2860393 RepID=A0ABS6WRS1_9HYPH|nr:hypothetical protein [Pseudohoeflea sp. DP4N28-3]MBW3097739.1 hypothetical protein [Pseudohoeflea sp. DP4N28-3]